MGAVLKSTVSKELANAFYALLAFSCGFGFYCFNFMGLKGGFVYMIRFEQANVIRFVALRCLWHLMSLAGNSENGKPISNLIINCYTHF